MAIVQTFSAVIVSLFTTGAAAQPISNTLSGFQLPKPESEYDIKLLDDVSRGGWHHVHVQAENGEPAFAYSLGFYANHGQPEVIVFGLRPQTAQQLLNIVAIRFAGAKKPYETFKAYSDIAKGMKIAFVPVAKKHYPTYFGYAGWFYESIKADFPAIQMVWPDKQGRLPWESGYDKAFYTLQPLLDK